jgi:Planctomycete cytochrome C
MGFRSLLPAGLAAAAVFAQTACSSDGPACVSVTTDCSPLYAPSFDDIFSRTLAPTCAQPGSACHSTSGLQGGLYFATATSAYALLLGEGNVAATVVPGDASCSPLVERLESNDPATLMPPGSKLSDAEICAVVQWIQEGAKR